MVPDFIRRSFLLALLILLPFGMRLGAQQTKTLPIILTQPYTDTGLQITAGQALTITATGTLNWATNGCASGATCIATPAGQSCPDTGFAAQGLPCWSLIGEIGQNGTAFEVGASLSFIARTSGELFLGVNDNFYPDNSGTWTATIAISAAPTCAQLISHGVSAATNGSLSLTGQPTSIGAQLTILSPYGLADAEYGCNVNNFEWQNQVLYLPGPNPFWAFTDPCVQNNLGQFAYVANCPSMSAAPAFLDPPQGGYTYSHPGSFPFFYDPGTLKNLEPNSNTLLFEATPSDPCLAAGTQSAAASQQLLAYCGGIYARSSAYILFKTSLVGIDSSNNPVDLHLNPLDDSFLWASTFNGTAGGRAQLSGIAGADTASGSGGVTLLMVNGISSVTGPLVFPSGVVNAASFAASTPVAPGSIAAVFGNLFLGGSMAATSTPLPANLSGLAMQFDGSSSAPLFYASATQANVQIPWELSGKPGSLLSVTASGVANAFGQGVTLAPYAPGIFSINGTGSGQGAIQNSSFQLVDISNPAHAGSTTIVIYCTGLGTVTNQPPTGQIALANPLSQTTTLPLVYIGGVAASVSFSGLVPGEVGLYQVNAIVPGGVAPGLLVPVSLAIGGVSSNTVTIVVQ